MIALLFFFSGRIGRLKFFVTSTVVGAIAIALLWSILVDPIVKAIYFHGFAFDASKVSISRADIEKSFIVVAVVAWIQLSLVWKRTRDMNESMALAYSYVCFVVLSFIPFIGLLFQLFNCIIALILLFKPSKDNAAHSTNPEVFGSRSSIEDDHGETTSDFASQLTDAELLARADQLRKQQPSAISVPQNGATKNTARAAPKGFGRRTRLQPS